MTIVWPGVPGETFHNSTEKILYQLVCSLVNTCGACMQYHLAIAKWWSPFHRGCNCRSVPIYPDKTSAPYEDFREIIDGLPEDQQKKVVGMSNLKLIEAGVVDWEDVVTPTRVKLFREVVSTKQLTVLDMTDAGVKKYIAEDAWESVNTPAHVIADRQRSQLIKQIEDLGILPGHLEEMFGDIMAQRIGIGSGPSGPSAIPPGRSDDQWIETLLGSIGGAALGGVSPEPSPALTPAPEPIPTSQSTPLPQTIEEFAQEATAAAEAVPLDARYTETKVWIIDAYNEFKKSYPDATIDQFKQDLVAANIARLITLARFDVPGQLSKAMLAKDAASEVSQGLATFHQIRLPLP